MDFEAEINSLKDTLVVMAEIQRRQADVQRTQAERVAEHDKWMGRVERNLAEATDKLNALIEIVDGVIRKRPPKSPPS